MGYNHTRFVCRAVARWSIIFAGAYGADSDRATRSTFQKSLYTGLEETKRLLPSGVQAGNAGV
jgi:hypothetical protein